MMLNAFQTLTTDESALPGLLQRIVKEIEDSKCGYWLYSNYFDVLPPTERTLIRWWHAPLYIDYDALWNPIFEDDALMIDVILKNKLPTQHERIRVEYTQIWSLGSCQHSGKMFRQIEYTD